jgi:peroxiredoxin
MLAVGDRAPDVELVRSDGHCVRLSTFWARGPVIFVFLRHFG